MSSKISEIKNNPPEPVNIIFIPNLDVFLNIKTALPKFGTNKKKAETALGRNKHLIISYVSESESESTFNLNSNSDNNNDENNGSSFIQNSNKNYDDLNSDLNSEQYIALPDLSKEQKLKWFSDNDEGIMPEHMHNTNAEFDLKYPKKNAIKLKLYSCTCIDLKLALEISTTTMIQLAFKSSLVKRRINIRGGIIDTGYIRNIIAMLQNDSEKVYIIEPNKKIAQTIFLPLVKIAQLVSVGKRKELEITVRRIQRFGSTGRINIPVQIFEIEATLCESEKIGLVNLHILAKNHSYIRIFIYNNIENIIKIPEETNIGYLTTKIKDQLPNPISDFPQLCGYVNITSQTITIETDELEKSRSITMY
ncbi:hypothetical protein G9A89_008335, partial [Geosiphon pyriformis]